MLNYVGRLVVVCGFVVASSAYAEEWLHHGVQRNASYDYVGMYLREIYVSYKYLSAVYLTFTDPTHRHTFFIIKSIY